MTLRLPEEISTERLTIRPFRSEDLEAYLSFMTDERATRHLLFTDEQKTVDGATALFEAVVGSYGSEEPIFAYAIALRDGRFVGSCGISEVSDGVWECYYSLLPDRWGNGYATEATRALIRHCFEHYPIREIRAYMSGENPDSARVAERAGMAYRGVQEHPLSGTKGRLYSITQKRRR